MEARSEEEADEDLDSVGAGARTVADERLGAAAVDPRALLAAWANEKDEWVRAIVGEVIQSGVRLSDAQVDAAHELFRQEKGLDDRALGAVGPLALDAVVDETAPPLAIVRLSEVRSVNALIAGEVIEPHAGLTVIYGENGTGKTGYARIFKALAKSRTDGPILPDVAIGSPDAPSARIAYTLAGEEGELAWSGEHGVAPFTRMSIFDSPCVTYHVDEDLDYVYVPAALALFNHVSAAIREVQSRIDDRISSLSQGAASLLDRFPRESSVYAQIETLGAATDLDAEGEGHLGPERRGPRWHLAPGCCRPGKQQSADADPVAPA